ncbi:MAG TPA: M20/M25/M40 family metallo-hydrolase [Vicinamibacteria bacterium]|nr:M20/M25/M40 family metallo-hydrolase [Vicinamibacteria bacterium]
MRNGELRAALGYVDDHFADFERALGDLVRIPSVSATGFPPEAVRRSADAMAQVLTAAGLENAEILELPGVHPYVYADWRHARGAPTLILYGHHDVVPPGRLERWISPPFEPTRRGGRLFGRGSADDKGGILVHVAAVTAWLRACGGLPLNVKFLVEGEEEIGSEHLAEFLAAQRGRMAADAVVLSDTSNFDVGVPALTYRLRGLVQVDVEVRCLERPVHSGQKGGAVPDALRILCGLIAGLQKTDGSLDIAGLYAKVARPGARERARLRALPFDERRFRRAAGLLPGVELNGERRYSVWERLWLRPSLTVIALEAPAIERSVNQVVEAARARLSMRTVPDQDSREAGDQLVARLTADPPSGARVTARIVRASPSWTTDLEAPAFDAARRALKAGFGREPVFMGAGGSIGFVQPMSDFLGGAPCLLTGVEDPACGAHSENEGLHLGDWRKCMRAAVRLYDELSRALPPTA